MSSVEISLRQLATDMLTLAGHGGMPETFFFTDQRIERACKVLGISPAEACHFAHRQEEEEE
jgi:hypothetical protein